MKKLSLAIIVIMLSTQLYAVDGYKSLKFGMSKEEVLQTGMCSFVEVKTGVDWAKVMSCIDFKIFGEKTMLLVFFIENKLLNIIIEVEYIKFMPLVRSIVKKYGPITSPHTEIDHVKELRIPNNMFKYGFDDDTIFLRIKISWDLVPSLDLNYQSPLWDVLSEKNRQAGMEDDI